MAFMFKGPAALTSGSTITSGGAIQGSSLATVSNGNITVNGSGTVTLGTGGLTLGSATILSITKLGSGSDDDKLVTKGYAASNYGGGAAAADTITNSATKALAPNTTYFINAGSAVNATVTDGTLVDGSLVRFVIDSGTADVVLTAGGALGGTGFQPMSGSDGTTLTLSGIGHSAQFVFHSNTLFAVSGGGTIA